MKNIFLNSIGYFKNSHLIFINAIPSKTSQVKKAKSCESLTVKHSEIICRVNFIYLISSDILFHKLLLDKDYFVNFSIPKHKEVIMSTFFYVLGWDDIIY